MKPERVAIATAVYVSAFFCLSATAETTVEQTTNHSRPRSLIRKRLNRDKRKLNHIFVQSAKDPGTEIPRRGQCLDDSSYRSKIGSICETIRQARLNCDGFSVPRWFLLPLRDGRMPRRTLPSRLLLFLVSLLTPEEFNPNQYFSSMATLCSCTCSLCEPLLNRMLLCMLLHSLTQNLLFRERKSLPSRINRNFATKDMPAWFSISNILQKNMLVAGRPSRSRSAMCGSLDELPS